MPKSTFDRIQDRIEAFVGEVTAIVNEALRVRLVAAQRDVTPRVAPRRRTRSDPQPRRTTVNRSPKRKAPQLDPTQESLLEVIQLNPGQRMEAISSLMQMSSKALSAPVKRLIAERLVRTKGQARATTYWAT